MTQARKKITVMGLGTLGGGVGTVQYFVRHGAHVTVTDLRSEAELHESLSKIPCDDITLVLGEHTVEDFTNADMILRNPAVPLESPYLQIARKNNIPIHMAESYFMCESPTKNIIGVTGTRGKSTTSAMIHHILTQAGYDSHLAGNQVHTSTLGVLDQITPESYVVLELSSWQLESFAWHSISPHIAVITNIYPDHLNRHASMSDYKLAKSHIARYQRPDDHLIVCAEEHDVCDFIQVTKATTHTISRTDLSDAITLQIPGAHNRSNAALAAHSASLCGVPEDVIERSLASFTGLKGRLEKLGSIKGVDIVNDTTSTTPAAGEIALKSYPRQTAIIIVGGNEKGLPLDDFVKTLSERAKAIVTIPGKGTDILEKKLESNDIPYSRTDSVNNALTKALSLADKNDTILFSPSFTSFAQFKNEFDRGDVFRHVYHQKKTAYKA